jgi:hypothetical protein
VRRLTCSIPDELAAVLSGLLTGRLPWPLYLWGPPGTGKTCAALCLLDQAGPAAAAGTWPPLVADWLAGFAEVRNLPALRINADQGRYQWSRDGQGGAVTWDHLRRALERAPVFVLDEIGVTGATDFRLDLMLDVLGCRCDDPVRPLVVTGNRAPGEIERVVYDARVASRILAGTVYHLDGPDRRLAVAPEE